MAEAASTGDGIEERFREEVRRNTHLTGIVGGVVAIIAFPAWAAFDWLVAPELAPEFTAIRIFSVVPIALFWGALFSDYGKRRPEMLMLGMLSIIEIAIAVMIARLDSDHAAYALGFSTALFASAFLLIWPPSYTISLVGISLAALGGSWVLVGDGAAASEIATVAFFAGTASVIAVAGQMIRERSSYREFAIRIELEQEQERSRRLVEELEQLTREDALTGLGNRRAWDEALALECARAERGVSTFSVLLCDIDRLKLINDNHGHAVGDSLIRAIAEVIGARVRSADVAARIGGDEFAILLAGSDLGSAASLAESIRSSVEAELPPIGGVQKPTVSIGVADWEGEGDGAEALMLRADRRLYVAKSARNSVATSIDMRAA